MNSNNPFGGPQAPGTVSQSTGLFGQTSAFGQTASGLSAPSFGQSSLGQSSSIFGPLSTNQTASAFGQSTPSQSPAFGQTAAVQSLPSFGQTSSGFSTPAFGQVSSGQSAPAFGQSVPAFGQVASGQSGPLFGQGTSGQSGSVFGQSSSAQSSSVFGQSTSGQSGSVFGQTSSAQSSSMFGQSTSTQSGSIFGKTTSSGQTGPMFGQAPSGQSGSVFGQAASGQSGVVFGQTSSGPSGSVFGQGSTGQSGSVFGQSSSGQSQPAFGQGTSVFGQANPGQSAPAFGQTPAFGLGTTGQPAPAFGQSSANQPTPAFGQSLPAFGQTNPNQPSLFGQVASTQSTSPFAQATTTQSNTLFTQPSNSQSSLFSSNANQTGSAFSQAVTSQQSVSFVGGASAFGQAASAPSAFEQLPKQSQGESGQSSVFGQSASGTTLALGQTASSQAPLFGQSSAGKSLGQTANTQSEQDASRQNVAFGQAATGQSSQASTFGQLSSTQPLSAQTTPFTIVSGTQTGQASVFGENSDKRSVFGPPSRSSSPGQNKNVGLAFGVTSQLSTNSNVSDSKLSSSLMQSPFGQMSSISSGNTAFKPVLPGSGKTQEAADKPFFGNQAPGLDRGTHSLFSFNADKKLKDESGSLRPQFANTESSFSSMSEDTGREESLKGMKRKEGSGSTPYRHDLAPFDDAASDFQSEHPPVKRPPRRTRELQGGANLLVRSLYDVVKSHIKTQQKVESKREEELETQFSDPDAPGMSQAAEKSCPSSESSQSRPSKMQPPAVPSQPAQNKPHAFGNQGPPSRISVVAPSQQPPDRELSIAGPSQQVSITIRPRLDEQDLRSKPKAPAPKTPLRRARRSDSTDSLTSVSPNELTTLQLKSLPKHLNTHRILNQFFRKFGKMLRPQCRPANMSAIIPFTQHKNALAAKKAVKNLHKDVSAFWFRKKNSQNKESPPTNRENKQGPRMMETQAEQKSAAVPVHAIPPLLPGLKASPQKKPQVSKAIQFDDVNTTPITAMPDVPIPSLPPSVMQLVGMVAETSEERYRLLDQRDKILRQARVKRTELDQAKVFVGTCTDMCPEKERYMRDTRNQLSIYELLPGTDKIDHAAAIKEYSRSSADQEEPLPHELRPLPVLCMTMDYLVTYIMDHGENNYRDWYDFVWNRTRGIRKDITQQHLCDPVTVSLMEKCMRFHIHCAYELCEESLSLFDPKINNENLTKCLQSLKEMYQDLENRGETCPCESEFRGYSVLLNLNKGDILREVQQFRESVRNSPEVKFAVQVFSAFSSSNYVRFFKLVHSTTYLNSCILHGYFGQIRRTALRTLNIAYTVSPQRSSLFPLEEMVRLLMFQDADQAATFLAAYGLNVSDGLVELNRLAFAEPEVPLQSTKSLFISQKCQVSVGEIVNGAPLPIFSLYVPVCSFDAQNRYTGVSSSSEGALKAGQEAAVPVIADKPEVREAKSEEKSIKRSIILVQDSQEPPSSIPAQSVFQPIMPPEAPPSPPKPAFTDEDVAAVLDELLDDVVRGFSADVSQTAAAYVSAALGESSLVADGLLTDVTLDMLHTISKEEIRAETQRVEEEKRRKAEEARRIQEREQLLSKLSQSECEDLLNKVLQENIRKIASDKLREAIQADHKERVSRCSQDISDKFVDDFVEEELDHIARETLFEMQLFKKYLQRWREVLAARKKLRRQMRGFPAAPGLMGHKGTLKALIPSAVHTLHNQPKGIVDLGHAGKMFVSVVSPQQRTEQNLHKMKVQHIFQELLCDTAWKPLDIPSLIVKSVPSWKNCIFWKVVLALPETSQPNDLNSFLSDWLKAKFSWAGIQLTEDQNQVQTLAVYNTLQSQEGWPVSINVAVKMVHGPLTDSELDDAEYQNELWGTSSLVLLLPFQSEPTDEYWISAVLQLKQLLNMKPFKPAPSLAVLMPGNCPDAKQKVEQELCLLDLVSCDLISDYIVISIPETVTNMKGTEMVTSAVQFLLSRCPSSPQLHALPFQQYVEDGVYRLFSDSFYYDMSKRKKHGLPSQDPSAIIDFYNSAIAFLAEGVSLSKLGELSWPMTEFTTSRGSFVMPPMDWNSLEHLAWLKKAILSFQIPQMDKSPEGAPWHLVCSMIGDYVSQICKSSEALPVLDSEVQMLLEGALKHCLDQKAVEETNVELSAQEIPWDDLVALCVNHKLREWNPPFSTFDKGSLEDLNVYFFEEDLEHFGMPETWIKARINTDKEVLASSESSSCKRRRTVQLPQTVHSSLSHKEKTRKDNENRKSLPSSYFQLYDNQEDESSPSKKKHTSESPPAAVSSFAANAESTQKQLDHLKSYQLRLQRALLVEKQESERFNEKLQQMLEEEPLDITLNLPQYLTNTSLPGALESAIVSPSPKDPSIFSTSLMFSRPESAIGSHSPSPSLKELMNSLHMGIKKYRDEDIAFNLHFSTLLDVGEPSSPPK